MSAAGVLLRVLLVLSLVLNGISGPIAASAMAVAPAASTDAADSVATDTALQHPGCHDHALAPDHPPPPPAEPTGKPGHADCCGVGLCGCACAQPPALAALELMLVPSDIEFVRLSDVFDSQRPEPPLPHLIRPPIA